MLPWPLPGGWLVTGFAAVGDERSGTRACAVALSGPNPLGGPAEMLLICEELGVGLGAYCAGLVGPDPGDGFPASSPHAQVEFGNHDFPLWNIDSPGRAAFVGELMGGWLWVLLWPDTAGTLLVESLRAARPAGPRPGPRPAVRRPLAPPAWLSSASRHRPARVSACAPICTATASPPTAPGRRPR